MRRRVGRELEPAGGRRGRRAVLDAEDELAVAAAEIEVAIAPSVQVPRAAQRLAVRAAGPGVFAQVVDEDESESELVRALERAQLAEDRGHLARRVFVDPVQAHKRIEQEGPRAVAVEGGTQAGAIARGIETEGRRDDEAEVEIAEAEAAGGGDRREARAQVGGGVLGAVEEDGAGLRPGEATERRGAGRDRDRDVEGEPGLPDLGGAADHADAVGTPEARTAVIREQCVTAVSEGDGDARSRPG